MSVEFHGKEFYVEIIDGLATLDFSNKKIKNISEIKGLENLVDQESLNLTDNKITEIYGLNTLKNLQELFLGWNKITKISGLEYQINLRKLYQQCNKIIKIEGLENLVKLEKIDLVKNPLSDKIQVYEDPQRMVRYCQAHKKSSPAEILKVKKKVQTKKIEKKYHYDKQKIFKIVRLTTLIFTTITFFMNLIAFILNLIGLSRLLDDPTLSLRLIGIILVLKELFPMIISFTLALCVISIIFKQES